MTNVSNKLRSIFKLILLFSLIFIAGAGSKSLTREALEMQQALHALDKNPKSNTLQKKYLDKFPKNIRIFRKLFAQPDFSELYSGSYKYIFRLKDLAKNHPVIVGKILISISKDAHYEADSLAYLQSTLAEYIVNYTAHFVKLLKKYSKNDVSNLVKYLADVENHSAYEEYPIIIKNLNKLGEHELAKQFALERDKRKKIKH